MSITYSRHIGIGRMKETKMLVCIPMRRCKYEHRMGKYRDGIWAPAS